MEANKHFVVGIFDDHDILLEAIKNIRDQGIKIYEVFSPYPVHGVEHALGYKRSWMPTAAFVFGVVGTLLATLMQVWMLGVDWPMIIGGKPYISIPDFIPVIFESTVLLAAFGMGFTFFGTRDLKPHKVPRIFDRRSTDNKHVMAIDLAKNTQTDAEKIKDMLQAVAAEEVYTKEFSDEENKGSFVNYLVDLFTNGVTSSSRPLNQF